MPTRRTFLHATAALTGATLFSCRRDVVPPLDPPVGLDDAAWDPVRAQFATDPGVAYLNNASLGMPPRAVAAEVARGYALHAADPLRAKYELQDIVANRSVPNLARFVGAHLDEISLTRNATDALHLAAIGLNLQPGDEVLMTTQEHPAGARPWRYRQAMDGIAVREVFIPSPFQSAQEVVDLMTQAISPRTRALAFCHVTRGGHLYPVKQLCAMARERGLATSVDGAQAVGMFPVDLHDLGCDAYSASLHKWLLGPVGTGMLYVRRGAREQWTSAYAHDGTPDNPAYAPPGTADLPLRAAIDTAVGFLSSIGVDAIAARNRALSNYLKERVTTLPGSTLVSGPTDQVSAPGSTIFVIDGVNPYDAVERLNAQGLFIDEHDRDGHPALRVSTHFYNTTEQIDRVVDAVRELRA